MEGFQYTAPQYYYSEPEVQVANTLPMSYNYFAITMNPHVDVASHNSNMHVASLNNHSDSFSFANYNS